MRLLKLNFRKRVGSALTMLPSPQSLNALLTRSSKSIHLHPNLSNESNKKIINTYNL